MALADVPLALVPLFVIVDPFASLGLFFGLSQGASRRERYLIAVKACAFAAAVLLAFSFAGKELLRYLGIELYSLQVAGGLLLVIIGLNMLREGREIPADEIPLIPLPTGGSHPPAGGNGGRPPRYDPSLVPLGLPMLAGPGAISLVIVQTTTFGLGTLSLAIAAAMSASLLILLAAARMQHVLGENGARVVTRIMGLLTVAFAAQYVLDGISGWREASGA